MPSALSAAASASTSARSAASLSSPTTWPPSRSNCSRSRAPRCRLRARGRRGKPPRTRRSSPHRWRLERRVGTGHGLPSNRSAPCAGPSALRTPRPPPSSASAVAWRFVAFTQLAFSFTHCWLARKARALRSTFASSYSLASSRCLRQILAEERGSGRRRAPPGMPRAHRRTRPWKSERCPSPWPPRRPPCPSHRRFRRCPWRRRRVGGAWTRRPRARACVAPRAATSAFCTNGDRDSCVPAVRRRGTLGVRVKPKEARELGQRRR